MTGVTFGLNLRRVLMLRGLQQIDVVTAAKHSSITAVQMSKWMHPENRNIELESLFRLAVAISAAKPVMPCCIEELCEFQDQEYDATLRSDHSPERMARLMQRMEQADLGQLFWFAQRMARAPAGDAVDAS
jgi:hypothetical protein